MLSMFLNSTAHRFEHFMPLLRSTRSLVSSAAIVSYRRSSCALLPFDLARQQFSHPAQLNLFWQRSLACSQLHIHTTAHKQIFSLSEKKSEEKLKKVEDAIMKEHTEKKPEGLFQKFKYYFKRYWYIAIPVHLINCSFWFLAFYLIVKSGLDVVSLLEKCRLPNGIIEKVKSIPPNAGVVVVALLLYKIATPLRYASTLILIRLIFPVLQRFGLKTAKEFKYKMRLRYTNKIKRMKRRYQQNKRRSSGTNVRKS